MNDGSGADGVATDAGDVLDGALVRELVARHEAEIADLEDRLAVAEASAADVERTVRRHPALLLLHPDDVRRLVPEPTEPHSTDGPPPRTTVVHRTAAPPPATERTPVRADRAGPVDAHPTDTGPAGLGSRIVRSHWWWRVGIAVVIVAVLLLKFG